MEVKDHLDFPEINILHRIVLVSEEEKLKMRKVFTGEKYEISGNVQKVD
jgi:predicted RNA-binding protein